MFAVTRLSRGESHGKREFLKKEIDKSRKTKEHARPIDPAEKQEPAPTDARQGYIQPRYLHV